MPADGTAAPAPDTSPDEPRKRPGGVSRGRTLTTLDLAQLAELASAADAPSNHTVPSRTPTVKLSSGATIARVASGAAAPDGDGGEEEDEFGTEPESSDVSAFYRNGLGVRPGGVEPLLHVHLTLTQPLYSRLVRAPYTTRAVSSCDSTEAVSHPLCGAPSRPLPHTAAHSLRSPPPRRRTSCSAST
jgi:hypothetical protein